MKLRENAIAFIIIICVSPMILRRMVHIKCRNNTYPFSAVRRLEFSDEQVSWDVEFKEYDPPEYSSLSLRGKPWADPPIDDPNFKPKWNEMDDTLNRVSFTGVYRIVDSMPLNPEGRTGLKGRGVLGKWGPNHAADPIVTRWKMMAGDVAKNSNTNLPILQFCAIQRRDCGQWALPGGMVDSGELVSETLRREFIEEALNGLEASREQREKDESMIKEFFRNGKTVFKGYVDDPRNTDNSWMETVAVNFHDSDGHAVGKFDLKAGDDAQNVRWVDIDKNLELYSNHLSFIKIVVDLLGAHW